MVGLVAVGVGAWAAYSFLTTGPQPAEALPAKTLGYVSIDLDPSGGQKIEALQTLNKFPAFKDYVGINADDDLRKEIFSRIQDEANCDDLDYADDIEPWLGDRAAVAAVDVGGDDPDPVFVLQVKDADKADAGLDTIKDCGDGGDVGWAIEGDWAVIAESDDIADKVVAETKKGSLADDDDFKHWTDEAGDPGVVTLYAGPAAGDYLADHADSMFGFPLGLVAGSSTECFGSSSEDGTTTEECTDGLPARWLRRVRDVATTDSRRSRPAARRSPTTSRPSSATSRAWPRPCGSTTAPSSSRRRVTATSAGSSCSPTAAPRPTWSSRCRPTPRPRYGLGFADGWFGDIVDHVRAVHRRERRGR